MQRSVEKQTLLTGTVHLANLSVKLGGSGIFEQRKTLTTRKISCDEEPILAAKTASHEIFRVVSCVSLFKKNSTVTSFSDVLPILHPKIVLLMFTIWYYRFQYYSLYANAKQAS